MTLDGLKENISFKLENTFPLVIVNSLNVLRNDEEDSITVQLKYSVADSNINDTITLQF